MKRGALAVAGVLALTILSAARTVAPACAGAICGGVELGPFLTALQTARARPVHILQIGDSHTANDNFAGAWRDLLQARYGDAGRGVLPPGRPWAGYVMRQVGVIQSPGWTQVSALQARKTGRQDLAFGASGFRLAAPSAGGDLRLLADQGHGFRRFVACAATGPQAGVMTLSIGPRSASVQLRAAKPGAVCSSLTSDEDEEAASVAGSGQAVLLSWAAFTGRAGVVVSNLGLPGAELAHMGLGGDEALRAELAAYTPDLIVIAYGTNEGFAPNFSSADYEAVLRGQISRLRYIAPGAPILLLGAPDAQSRLLALTSNSDQGHRARIGADGWFSPPALQDVRAIQRRVALDAHVALWDWAARMGGPGAASAWASARPPLMRADHVHYTPLGGQRLAEQLQNDLDVLCRAVCRRG